MSYVLKWDKVISTSPLQPLLSSSKYDNSVPLTNSIFPSYSDSNGLNYTNNIGFNNFIWSPTINLKFEKCKSLC